MRKFEFSNDDKIEIQKWIVDIKDRISKAKTNRYNLISIGSIDDMSNPVWVFLRSVLGLGGSDAGIITGSSTFSGANKISLYKSKFPDLYLGEEISSSRIDEICSILEEQQNKDMTEEKQYIFDIGHLKESFIRNAFVEHFDEDYKTFLEDQFGKKISSIRAYDDTNMYLRIDTPTFADLDSKVDIEFEDGSSLTGILEFKTTQPYNVEEKFGSSKTGFFAPASYVDQVQHYMSMSDYTFTVLVFDGGSYAKSGIRFIPRDEDRINEIIKAEKDFWFNNVLKQIEPKVFDKPVLSELAGKPIEEGEQHLGRVLGKDAEQVLALQQEKKGIDKRSRDLANEIDTLKSSIAQRMKCNTGITSFDGKTFRVTQQDKSYARFNKNKCLKEHPELDATFNAYTNTTMTRTVDIKEIDTIS